MSLRSSEILSSGLDDSSAMPIPEFGKTFER